MNTLKQRGEGKSLTFFRYTGYFCLLIITAASLLMSCRKEDNNYHLEGRITFADDGQAMSGVAAKVNKQELQNGVFSGSYSTAASGVTSSDGMYSLSWPRENFAALQLVLEKPQYITREIDLNVSGFSAGNTVTGNYSMYSEAFVSVHIQNEGTANVSDQFDFTFTNAEFDCSCCSNGWKYFSGADVDTTFSCRVYGNTWVKYRKIIQTSEVDTLVNDSVWCPAFQTANISLSY